MINRLSTIYKIKSIYRLSRISRSLYTGPDNREIVKTKETDEDNKEVSVQYVYINPLVVEKINSDKFIEKITR